MYWTYEVVICFSAYSYDEIEEKAKALRRSASHTATDDVSGVDVSAMMSQIKSFSISIVFFFDLALFLFNVPTQA